MTLAKESMRMQDAESERQQCASCEEEQFQMTEFVRAGSGCSSTGIGW